MTELDGTVAAASYADWTGHVIVCGLRAVTLRTVELLNRAGVRVVVVDDAADPRLAPVVAGWGVPRVVGSPRLPETLAAVGLAGAVAIVCVQEDDLHTLESALIARQSRPDIRVVVLLRNPAVGRAVAGIGVAVLDVARLSATSMVEACLQTGVHEVDLDGERFLAVTTTAARPGTLRDLYGDLAPVAVAPADGSELVVCPGRDHPVGTGDAVTLLGAPHRVPAPARSPEHQTRRPAGRGGEGKAGEDRPGGDRPGERGNRPPRTVGGGAGMRRRVWTAAASLANAVDRRLLLPLLGLLIVLVVSTVVLRLGYRGAGSRGMTVVDAVYFTVETVTTIGYGDFSFRDQPAWLHVYAIGLMIVGTMLVAVFFAMLTNLLISRRIEEALGRRRVTGMAGHVVVIGLGSVGVGVVERLHAEGAAVVVVDRDPGNRYLDRIRALGVPVVVADGTQPQTLHEVSLARARAVAVLTSDDLVNLETGLAVRDQLGERWARVPVVLRLFDEHLAHTVAHSFGFGSVRSTAALAAPWFVGAALGLDILGTFYVGPLPMLVARLTVAPGGGLDGLTMGELSARTRVVAISRSGGGRLEHPPRRGTRFHAGDRAYLVGPYEELLQVLRRDSADGTAAGRG